MISRIALFLLPLSLIVLCCTAPRKIGGKTAKNPLEIAMSAHQSSLDSILSHPEKWEVQIIYTQIDRDANQVPHFTSYHWNVDSARYFYPASTVKMPLAFLALEKINHLNQQYPRLSKDTPYKIDSLRPYQEKVQRDTSAPSAKPTIAHDIRGIFVTSDNRAYNHLFEFLGRQYINETLRAKGYTRTGIVHRFDFPKRDNSYSSPITFFEPTIGIYQQGEIRDKSVWKCPQHGTQKGKGYINGEDQLVQLPFDMSNKNWFALTDMEKMLRAVIFPETAPVANRFDLSEKDYQFLYRYMGLFPRECDYPKYDPKIYYDGYVKFLMFGDSKTQLDGSIRSFNKVGEAYGTLTDVAYIVDYEHNTEFFLSATIYCNSDGIFNDDQYDYENVGFPFLDKLGKAVYDYDVKRPRKIKPDLSKFNIRF